MNCVIEHGTVAMDYTAIQSTVQAAGLSSLLNWRIPCTAAVQHILHTYHSSLQRMSIPMLYHIKSKEQSMAVLLKGVCDGGESYIASSKRAQDDGQ